MNKKNIKKKRVLKYTAIVRSELGRKENDHVIAKKNFKSYKDADKYCDKMIRKINEYPANADACILRKKEKLRIKKH